MELYIIRHGQSTNNVSMLTNVYDRVPDPPLTDLGKRQAEAVAQHLLSGSNVASFVESKLLNEPTQVGFGITRLYCSPMLRALQTCQPISAALGLKPSVWIEVHEHGGMFMDYRDERGIVGMSGMTREEILLGFPDYHLPETFGLQGWWNPSSGEEDLAAAQARAIRVAGALREQADSDERIAIVTHGVFVDCLLKALLSQLPGKGHFYGHNNTGITRVDFAERGHLRLRFTNRVDHLTPDMISE